MKLREPTIPDWLGYSIGIPVLLAVSPIIAGCAVAVALIWAKCQLIGPQKEWQRWFAWYPARIRDEHGWPMELRWLEMVERRSFGIMQDTQFRAVK